jgi:choline dehydrogenase-like flavoprotein
MKPLDYSAETYVGRQIHTSATWVEKHGRGKRISPKNVDAVIVGTGPGGLACASVLAASGMSVVLVEAGKFWPRGSFKRQQSWALDNLYQDKGARVMRGNTFIPLASGRGVGGGTLVNSGISFRTPDRILDAWTAEHGLDYWADRDSLYEEVEQAIGVTPPAAQIAGQNTAVVKRGFEAIGAEHAYMPRNTPGCVACGTCQTGCPSGGKASSDLNWLPRALRAGAELYAECRVDEIVMEGNRAVGVRGNMRDDSGEVVAELDVRAERVILAAGSVSTPLLLLAQGLANSSDQVGRNLRCHPGGGVAAEMDEDVRVWYGATQGYYAYHPTERDILAESFSAPPEAFFTQFGDVGEKSHEFLRRLRKFASAGFLVKDDSSGRIQHTGGPPNITYSVIDKDRRKFTTGFEFVAEMFFAAGSRRVRPALNGAKWFTSFNEARQFIRGVTDPAEFMLYASHPMGTCRISADPAKGVVRPEDGRTHDHEGLYVVDASLMPTALGVNPQMTIMAQSLALSRRMLRA